MSEKVNKNEIESENPLADFVTEFPSLSKSEIFLCRRERNTTKLIYLADYEAFLDSQINEIDEKYLQDTEIARQFVELGYRGIGRTISRREFVKRKERAQSVFIARREIAIPILSDCLSVTKPLPLALAAREELNRTARLLTIVFIRDRNDLSEEISGYIDFSQRLKTEDLTNFFLGRTKLLPQTSDLSFYNWNTNFTVHNDTKNFRFHPDVQGIRFRCEHDRKFVLIDPQITEEQHGTARSVIQTSEYLQVVLYVRFVDRNEFGPRLNQFFSFSRITG